jgi:hypothetical protein
MSTFYAYRQNVYTKWRFLNMWAQMGNHGNLWAIYASTASIYAYMF